MLEQSKARLEAAGISVLGITDHTIFRSIYFFDPEGNRIECFCDTPWYVDQPMVILWDLQLSDEALWAWLADKVKTLPGYEPVEVWRERITRRMQEHQAASENP